MKLAFLTFAAVLVWILFLILILSGCASDPLQAYNDCQVQASKRVDYSKPDWLERQIVETDECLKGKQ